MLLAMIVKNDSLKINSNKNFEIIDITSQITEKILIKDGIVNIFSKHSTSAILVNENEEGLLRDLELILNDMISDNYSYEHDMIDNNAKSHLKSFILSPSETIPIKNSKLDIGIWQSVFFVELDGPRNNRIVDLTFMGEK